MAELERELALVGRAVEFPPTPDLVAAVRSGLRRPPEPRLRMRRRRLVLAFAALGAAIGIAFAVPPARTAILRVFGVGGVRIELVDRLPATELERPFRPGAPVTLAEARRRAGFAVGVPREGGFDRPGEVFFSSAVPGGLVSFLYGSEARPRAILSQFQSSGIFAEKAVAPGTTLEVVEIHGQRGYWLDGRPHEFAFRDREGRTRLSTLRLARNTLVWERNGVTLRLEGDLSRDEALAVASSIP